MILVQHLYNKDLINFFIYVGYMYSKVFLFCYYACLYIMQETRYLGEISLALVQYYI